MEPAGREAFDAIERTACLIPSALETTHETRLIDRLRGVWVDPNGGVVPLHRGRELARLRELLPPRATTSPLGEV